LKLKEIYGPINKEIGELDRKLKDLYKEIEGDEIKAIIEYFFKSSGKYLRPSLAFLSAGAVSNGARIDKEKLIQLGMSLELLHSASLIHDDIIDEDLMRRGQKTVNNVFGNKIAVLAGDIFHAYSYALLSKNFHKDFSEEVTKLSIDMCSAEILQASGISNDENYYEMIKGKTALFTSTCCKLGALVGNATESETKHLEDFGLYFGFAYQIKDDFSDDDLPIGISVTLDEADTYAEMAKKSAMGLGDNDYTKMLCKLVDVVISKEY